MNGITPFFRPHETCTGYFLTGPKSYRDAGLASPMLRAAFHTFAAPRLLTAEQQDLLVFARAQGASLEILNLLQLAA